MTQSSLPQPHIGFIPTPFDVVEPLLNLAEITAEDVVYDLGCGDGRILIAAARLGARGVGIDVDERCLQQAQAAASAAGVSDRLTFWQQDLFSCDVRAATIVVLYLLPHLNLRLLPHLLSQLQPGARIVSHQFDLGDWTPDRVLHLPDSEESSTLYCWSLSAGCVSFG
ncbi:MAG: methyltransferase domain-containing protein [Leptolyngbyaceae cyanobacterium SM1_1_3]|nr:methyltransferase domain-containing protein [Leptolyngbyaceae cyanobacterium SM1_1_3]NJN01971.1 methyltransferase domain-containing protein [Leptolyngbyaceae cyanobacterium RM1_1_2]NJO10134.1 methyltransferase domain-containing protein [Leptolyngbyaceae cyanobacterium SL_1_1]